MTHSRGERSAFAVLIATLLLLGGCSSPADGPAEKGHSDLSGLLGHVHGLGVDPGDGALYVATHHGLYRVSAPGRLDPVGTSRRDLMGFSIAGPGTYRASGHPAPGERTANPLGLVESRDGGMSWTTLSLSGQSDFHALDAVGATVYGYDGVLRASADGGRTWQARSEIAVEDIAVNPHDPDMLIATTERGMVTSTDGGRTFGPAQAPVLVFVAWPAQGPIYGLASDGAVHTSSDATSWAKAGTISGQPQALGVGADGRVFLATTAGIFESRDTARTFTKLA